jgi:hypothetical protein
MDSKAFETITKNNFWQVIHDNQKGKYYRTRLTLLDELFLIDVTIQLYDLSTLALKHLAIFVINRSENTPNNPIQNRPRLWQRSPTQQKTDSASEKSTENNKHAHPRKRWRKLE